MTEPIPAQNAPYGVNSNLGRIIGGRSLRQPFCNGSHKSVGLAALKFSAAGTKQARLCGCKSSGDKPFCDGSHKSIRARQ